MCVNQPEQQNDIQGRRGLLLRANSVSNGSRRGLRRETSATRDGLIRHESSRSVTSRSKGDGRMHMEIPRTPSRRNLRSPIRRCDSSDSSGSFKPARRSRFHRRTASPLVARSNSHGNISYKSKRKNPAFSRVSTFPLPANPDYLHDGSHAGSIWKKESKKKSWTDIAWTFLVVGCLIMGFMVQLLSFYKLIFRPTEPSPATSEPALYCPAPESVFYEYPVVEETALVDGEETGALLK